MAMMTGNEYIESLRALNLRVYMFGKKVENPVDDPILRPSVNSVKMTYDLAQSPNYQDLMTAKSHLTGERVNRFTHIHQSTEDLVNKVKMQRLLGQLMPLLPELKEVILVHTVSESLLAQARELMGHHQPPAART